MNTDVRMHGETTQASSRRMNNIMTIPNIDSETGIPYGIIHANNLPELYDEIISMGESVTFREFRNQVLCELASSISCILSEHGISLSDPETAAEEIFDSADMNCWECDEEEYEYELDGVKILLSYLGGAALIWVIESPYVAPCKQCSPCIPHGGDLDNPDCEGSNAYSLPPEWLEENESLQPLKNLTRKLW